MNVAACCIYPNVRSPDCPNARTNDRIKNKIINMKPSGWCLVRQYVRLLRKFPGFPVLSALTVLTPVKT